MPRRILFAEAPPTVVYDNKAIDTTSPYSVSHTLGSGENRMVVLVVMSDASDDITLDGNPTYDGTSATLVGYHEEGLTQGGIWVVKEADLPSSGGSYTAAFSGLGSTSAVFQVLSYSGVNQTASLAHVSAGTAASNEIATPNINTQEDGAWLVGAWANNNAATWQNLGSGQVSRHEGSDGGGAYYTCDKKFPTQTATASMTADTTSSSRICCGAILLRPAALSVNAPTFSSQPEIRKRSDTTALIAATATEP